MEGYHILFPYSSFGHIICAELLQPSLTEPFPPTSGLWWCSLNNLHSTCITPGQRCTEMLTSAQVWLWCSPMHISTCNVTPLHAAPNHSALPCTAAGTLTNTPASQQSAFQVSLSYQLVVVWIISPNSINLNFPRHNLILLSPASISNLSSFPLYSYISLPLL